MPSPYVKLSLFCFLCCFIYHILLPLLRSQSWRQVWATLGATTVACSPEGSLVSLLLWVFLDEEGGEICRKLVWGFNDLLWHDIFVLVLLSLVIFNQNSVVLFPWRPWFLETWDFEKSVWVFCSWFSLFCKIDPLVIQALEKSFKKKKKKSPDKGSKPEWEKR